MIEGPLGKYYDGIKSVKLGTLRNMVSARVQMDDSGHPCDCGFASVSIHGDEPVIRSQIKALIETIERDADMEGGFYADYADIMNVGCMAPRPDQVAPDDAHLLYLALWSRFPTYPYAYGETGIGSCAVIRELSVWIAPGRSEHWLCPMYHLADRQQMFLLRVPFQKRFLTSLDLWLYEHSTAMLFKRPVFSSK